MFLLAVLGKQANLFFEKLSRTLVKFLRCLFNVLINVLFISILSCQLVFYLNICRIYHTIFFVYAYTLITQILNKTVNLNQLSLQNFLIHFYQRLDYLHFVFTVPSRLFQCRIYTNIQFIHDLH